MEMVDVDTPPNVRRKLSEVALLREFSQAKGHSRDAVLKILHRFQGDLKNVRDPSQKSLLHIACEIMDFIVVKFLIEQHDLGINEQDSCGNTPLHIACLNQKVQTVIFLVKEPGCDPNIRNSDGLTPLHVAARTGPGIIITHLLTMPALDRSLEDGEGRDAIAIICSDPNLAPSLDRKVSTASMGGVSVSSRGSIGDVHRKGELGY